MARESGMPRAVGVSLRAAGLLAGATGVGQLRDSCDVLAVRSPARLEHARSLVELGAALGRQNQRGEAREHLRSGLDLAPVVRRRTPRRSRRGGASREWRAAAAPSRGAALMRSLRARHARRAWRPEGWSNREIAQSLFVTPKTVENQLGRVYLKLGISGRDALPAVFGPA